MIGPGQTLESKDFAIKGMTTITLTFTAKTHNDVVDTEAYRVYAYYRIGDGTSTGPWCPLGSTTTRGSAQTFTVPQGALEEGKTIAFKLTNPKSYVSDGNGSFKCAAIDSISVAGTAKGQGDYSGYTDGSGWHDYAILDNASISSGTSKSYDITGLTEGDTVYFRVQALQQSGAVKSVWVEGSATTEAALVPQTVPVGNLSFTYGGAAKALTVTAPGSGTKHYSSDNDSVATVDSSGNVTPHAVGTAHITVTVDADSTYDSGTGTCTVTVSAANPTVTSGSATGITKNQATLKGTVTALGGAASLTGAGVVYKQGTSGSPSIGDDGVTAVAASSPALNTEFSVTAGSGTALTPGTAYRWRAYGTSSANKTGYGSATTFYTKCDTPTAPSGLTLERKSVQRIDLSWTAGALGTGGGVLHHLVLRTTSATPSGTPDEGTVYSAGDTIGDWTMAAIKDATTTTLQDTGLSADTVYYYKCIRMPR